MVVVAEYIWLDFKKRLRSKTKVIHNINYKVWSEIVKLPAQELAGKFPEWNYDGSSTNQAMGNDSEVIIKPVKVIDDPFEHGRNFLVLCDTWLPDGTPHPTNTREKARKIFEKYNKEEPLYGLEQEFFLSANGKPIA